MFEPQPGIQHLPVTREQVVAVVEGINQPQVSIPGRPAQAVTGHLCGLRNANGSFSVVVVIHLPATGENVVYLHSRRQLTSPEDYRAVEVEGLQFLESMGFMLDNLAYRNLDAAQQDEVLARVPLFHPPAAAPSGARGAPAGPDAARLARLLVAL